MKKIYFVLLTVLLSHGMFAQNVTVTATAGTPGPTGYSTVKLAFDAINAGTHQGNIIVNVNVTTDEGATPAVLNNSGSGSASYTTVLIRPTVDNVSIVGSATPGSRGIIELNGADNVTIDGDNPNSAGTNRNLTISMSTTNAGSLIWFKTPAAANGCLNNTVKNCNLTGQGTYTTISAIIAGSTTYGGAALAANSNNTIQNNAISRMQNGIYQNGVATTPFDVNWQIKDNLFGSSVLANKLGFRGMILLNAFGYVVNNNTITGVNSSTTTTSTMTGIQLGSECLNGTISNNKISDIKQNNTQGWGSNAIWLNATTIASNTNVYNNMISDVASVGFNDVTPTDNGYGIVLSSGGGYNLYYNTIVMNTNQTTANGLPAAINVTTGITTANTLNIRDNIIVNTQTVGTNRYCVLSSAAASVYQDINYNDYYFTGPNLGIIGGTNRATLAAWRTGTGKDLQSISVQPNFLSATDFHLVATSNCGINGKATPITTPAITTDIDGDTRNATTPDMGADEFNGNDPTATISYGGSPYCAVGTATVTQTGTTGGTYSSGAGLSINASTGVVNLAASTPGSYTVTYTIAASGSCAVFTTTTNITINTCADVSITKTDGSATYIAGGSITYTIVASNAGPSAANGTTVADIFPAAISGVNWTAVYAGGATGPASGTGNINATVNLPSGGSATFTATGTVAPATTGSLSNTATVTTAGGVTETNPANNSATDTDVKASVDLAITKTDGVTFYTPGGTTTYTIVVSNAGPQAAIGAIISDPFPSQVSFTNWTVAYAGGATGPASGTGNINFSANIPAGGTVTITAVCNLSITGLGPMSNTATVTAPGGVLETNPANNSATDTDTQASADLAITKTDGVTTYISGNTLTYTIVASNPSGPQGVTGAVVTDNFPATISAVSWTVAYAGGASGPASGSGNISATVDIPVGGTATFTAVCTVSGTASGTISNTATVAPPSGVADPTPGNNAATDTDTPTCDISSVSFTNISGCNDNGTPADASDDYFTADVTVTYSNAPASGNLQFQAGGDQLPGGGATSVAVGAATSPYTFTGVRFKADGTATNVVLEFSAGAGCNKAATGPTVATCSAGCAAPPSATISYNGSPYCQNAGTANVTQTGTAGGTYSSTAGLSLNASTGAITLGTSTPGTYTVTYSIAASGPCPAFSTTASVTVTATPNATISYAGSPYCQNGGTANVTQTGTAGGTYSSTVGLSLNTSTGAVTLGTSTAGTYTVTYTVAAAGGCAAFTTTTTITITATPSATISYAGTPYCSNAGTATVTRTGTAGGTYSSTAGLSLNASTGAITLGTSTAGTYTVTYTVAAAGGCAVFTTTTSVTITAAPNATISYAGSPYCQNAGTANVTQTGTAGGTYSSTAGLSINASTGAVTLGTSTPGTYTVTYTVAAAGGCAAFTTTATITITAPPTGTISYAGSPYCSNAGTATVTQTGTAGGTYSSTAGLSINASTGAITLGTSTAGTYIVTYTVAAAGGCAAFTATASVTVTAAPNATIAYAGSPYCTLGGTATVTQTGTAGGTYSSTAGLTLNATTGAVTLGTSTPGTYTVTYTVAAGGGCSAFTTTTTITITAAPVAPTGATASTPVICGATGLVTLTAAGGTAPAGATYKWYTGSCGGTLLGTGQVLSNIPVFTTTTFYVRIESACANTTCASVTVTVAPQPAVVITAVQNINNNLPPQTIYATVSPAGTYTYQWKRDGVVLPNTGDTLQIGAYPSASYTVTVTAVPSGCTATSNTLIIFDNPSVLVYVSPNPNHGQFNVSYYATPQEMGSTRKLMIYDDKGSRVFEKAYTVSLPYNIMHVDLSGLQARGIYFIALADGSGKIIASSKVMINK